MLAMYSNYPTTMYLVCMYILQFDKTRRCVLGFSTLEIIIEKIAIIETVLLSTNGHCSLFFVLWDLEENMLYIFFKQA